MKNIEYTISEDKEGLLEEGYFLASYDGILCLDEKDRTPKNICGEGLSGNGAMLFTKQIWKNMKNVKDVKMHMNETGSYDVYALLEAIKK